MAGILWTIIVLLVIFWVVGLAMHLFGGLIHIALVVAVVLFLVNLFTGRTRV